MSRTISQPPTADRNRNPEAMTTCSTWKGQGDASGHVEGGGGEDGAGRERSDGAGVKSRAGKQLCRRAGVVTQAQAWKLAAGYAGAARPTAAVAAPSSPRPDVAVPRRAPCSCFDG